FQAEDGIRDFHVTGVQTCALPISGEDKAARALREQLVDAQRLLEAVEAALAADGERLLDAEERLAIESQMQALRELLDSQDGARSEERRVGNECRTRGAAERGREQ